MPHSISLNLLLIATLISTLHATVPETLITYSQSKIGTTSESAQTQDALRLYTYYQAKLLNDLTAGDSTVAPPDFHLWGLLEKGHNAENLEQSLLEWHASVLKAQNWGDLTDFEWIKATSESDMILRFLNSA